MENVSVVIVTKGRSNLLERLLLSIKDQNQTSEIIVIQNDSSLRDYERVRQKFSKVFWINQCFSTPGLARNHGANLAKGNWILFLDDDVTLPENFFDKATTFLSEIPKSSSFFGGPDQGGPEVSFLEKSLSLALTSPMATAHTRLRHSKKGVGIRKGDESNLILCNLWVKKELFISKKVAFRPSFFRNEENVFISDALEMGFQGQYNPELYVYHKRKVRPDLLAKALISSGKHRVKSMVLSFNLRKLIFLIPGFWVLYLLLLSTFNQNPTFFYPLIFYIIFSFVASLWIARRNPISIGFVLLYQIFINFFYGIGILLGFSFLPFWILNRSKL